MTAAFGSVNPCVCLALCCVSCVSCLCPCPSLCISFLSRCLYTSLLWLPCASGPECAVAQQLSFPCTIPLGLFVQLAPSGLGKTPRSLRIRIVWFPRCPSCTHVFTHTKHAVTRPLGIAGTVSLAGPTSHAIIPQEVCHRLLPRVVSFLPALPTPCPSDLQSPLRSPCSISHGLQPSASSTVLLPRLSNELVDIEMYGLQNSPSNQLVHRPLSLSVLLERCSIALPVDSRLPVQGRVEGHLLRSLRKARECAVEVDAILAVCMV